MSLGIGECQCATPRTPKDHPLFDSKMLAQCLDSFVNHFATNILLTSMSDTKCQVVLFFRHAKGRLWPAPLWSSMMIRYTFGSKNCLFQASQPPPGPPWRKMTGLPESLRMRFNSVTHGSKYLLGCHTVHSKVHEVRPPSRNQFGRAQSVDTGLSWELRRSLFVVGREKKQNPRRLLHRRNESRRFHSILMKGFQTPWMDPTVEIFCAFCSLRGLMPHCLRMVWNSERMCSALSFFATSGLEYPFTEGKEYY